MISGETLFLMLLGHCIGDFALQPQKLALNKKASGYRGLSLCMVHCFIYTCTIIATMCLSTDFRDMLFSLESHLLQRFFIIMYLTHHMIDRTTFIDKYMRLMKIRSWNTDIDLEDGTITPKECITISFGTIVYIVIDNTFHLILMYLTLKFFYGIM